MFEFSNMKNLASLEIFVTVGKTRNFTKAAEQLGLTKSTISRQIQSLERDLGVVLIKRDPRHFSLTDEGSAFLIRAEAIMRETMDAFDEISSHQTGIRGAIRISTTVDLSLLYLTNPIAELSSLYPEIKFTIDLSPGTVDLKKEGFDMALRAGHLKDSGLFAKKLNEHQSGLYATSDYIQRMGRPKNLSDLSEHNIVANRRFEVDGSFFSPNIMANNMSVVKEITLKGAAIGLLSEAVIRAEKKQSHFIQVLPQYQLPKVPIYLLFPQKKLPKRITVLVENIFNHKL
jgi:LysR family transcriptional regulator for bpeEF and oprC